MKTRIEDKERAIVAARVVLSDVETVHDAEMLRAVGFAALFAAAKRLGTRERRSWPKS